MSSKILSAPESKWQQNPNPSGRKRDASNLIGQEFRGLPNRALITLVITLCGFGLMAVFSASAPDALQNFQDSTAYLRKQAIACAIGLFCMFTLSKYDYRKLKKFAWPLAIAALVLLAITLVPHLSVTQMGSSRWIPIGPIQFQPSELAKVATIILMASGISKYFWWHRNVFIRIIFVMAMAGIVVKQPDLGTAMMILGTLLSMLFVSGTNTLLILSAIGVGGALGWHHVQKTPYQMARIQSWLNPDLNPQKEGWNIIQAQLAIGSGGLWGQGFGHSLQKLFYLPVQHADFIFAVISEEFGLLGCLTILSLFGMFAYYGFQIALNARTLFGRFLAIGITSQISLQALVNIMVCTGMLPVTGITLPFLSYGGTSMVITLAMVGILLSISRDKGQEEEEEDSSEEH